MAWDIMAILGKKKTQLESNLKRAETLLNDAESKGIEILPQKQALFKARRNIQNKNWEEAEEAIKDSMITLQHALESYERAMNQKMREKNDIMNLMRRIEGYLERLRKIGIDLRIKLFEDVKLAFENGTDVNMKTALVKIEQMFNRPIFKPEVSWNFSVREKITAFLVVEDMILFGTTGKAVYAIDFDGNLLWKYRTADEVVASTAFGKLIIVSSGDKKIHCIDAWGNYVWDIDTNGVVNSLVNYSDLILAGSTDKNIYCLDAHGNQFWRYKTGGAVNSVGVIHDLVLAGSGDKNLYCLDHNGKLKWKVKTEDEVLSVMPFGNLIITLSRDNSLYCSDLEGNLDWKKIFQNEITSIETVGKYILVGLKDLGIWIYDDLGKTIAKVKIEDNIASIICSNDLIFAGSEKENLYCLDLNGAILWKKKTASRILSVLYANNFILVQTEKRIVAHSTSVIPVFNAVESQIREGRIKFTNIYEAEQLFDLAKQSFVDLESEKTGRLLNRITDILADHKKRVKHFEKNLNVHKPDYDLFDGILEAEYRENVIQGINSARSTITDIQSILITLLGKRANIESILMKQKDDNAINKNIADYSEKLNRAKDREKMSVARSYAFMIVNQKRKLQMKDRMVNIIAGIDEQINELSDFSKDLFDNAHEMPHDADLVGAFGILNNEAVQAIHDANKLIGDISEMETELNDVAVVNELAVGQGEIDISELHSDVQEEIERELGA